MWIAAISNFHHSHKCSLKTVGDGGKKIAVGICCVFSSVNVSRRTVSAHSSHARKSSSGSLMWGISRMRNITICRLFGRFSVISLRYSFVEFTVLSPAYVLSAFVVRLFLWATPTSHTKVIEHLIPLASEQFTWSYSLSKFVNNADHKRRALQWIRSNCRPGHFPRTLFNCVTYWRATAAIELKNVFLLMCTLRSSGVIFGHSHRWRRHHMAVSRCNHLARRYLNNGVNDFFGRMISSVIFATMFWLILYTSVLV